MGVLLGHIPMKCSSQGDRISDVIVEHEQAKIVARVQPNASQNQALGFKDGVLYVRIAAPPTISLSIEES
jgi:hypothetical protein